MDSEYPPQVNTSPSVLDSWDKLFTFALPNTHNFDGNYAQPAKQASTSEYSAFRPPAKEHAPAFYASEAADSVPPLQQRILSGLRHGIDALQRGPNPPQFPPASNIVLDLPVLDGKSSTEGDSLRYFTLVVEIIVKPVVLSIFRASGYKDVKLNIVDPTLQSSQKGDADLVVKWGDSRSTTVSVEYKSVDTLMRYASKSELGMGRRLQSSVKASGPSAIAIKVCTVSSPRTEGDTGLNVVCNCQLCLQMHNAEPTAARLGLLFSSHAFLLVERCRSFSC